jgi:hypothetical protein
LGSAYAGAIHDATLLLSRGTPVHERVGGTVTTMQKRKRPNSVDGLGCDHALTAGFLEAWTVHGSNLASVATPFLILLPLND